MPQLASDFELAADYSSATLTLREGATFHTGRPVTGEDIEWTLLRMRDEAWGSTGACRISRTWSTG